MATEADRQVRGREAGWLSVILRAASIVVAAIGCDRAVAPNANHAGPAIVAMLPVATRSTSVATSPTTGSLLLVAAAPGASIGTRNQGTGAGNRESKTPGTLISNREAPGGPTIPDSRFPIPGYCTALIMSKIGRYMATTMPPTTTPRNTIMTGSRRERSPPTAASTSSS